MKRTQTHRGRFYNEAGKKYPSITTVLSCISKPALVAWSGKVEREMVIEEAASLYDEGMETATGNITPPSKLAFILCLQQRLGKKLASQKLKEKAGDIGSQAHAFIEWTLRAELLQQTGRPCPVIGPEAQIAVDAWKEWRQTVNLRPIRAESWVVSKELGIAGTYDYVAAEINGLLTLLDWKTGKRVYYEAHLQNAFYRYAYREMGLGDPQAGVILRLPKSTEEPGFEPVEARNEAECIAIVRAVKQLWQDMQEQDKWLKEQDAKMELPEDLAPLLEASIKEAHRGWVAPGGMAGDSPAERKSAWILDHSVKSK